MGAQKGWVDTLVVGEGRIPPVTCGDGETPRFIRWRHRPSPSIGIPRHLALKPHRLGTHAVHRADLGVELLLKRRLHRAHIAREGDTPQHQQFIAQVGGHLINVALRELLIEMRIVDETDVLIRVAVPRVDTVRVEQTGLIEHQILARL